MILSMICFLLVCCGILHADNTPAPMPSAASSILATVNGKAVTLGEVLRESSSGEALAKAYTDQSKLSAEIAKLREETVDRIIDRKLLVDEFHRLKLVMPQKYVESMLDELAVNLNCRTRSELAAKARAMNSNVEEIRQKILEKLQAEMVVGREYYAVGEPTPEEMYNFFTGNIKDFSQPERIQLALLLLPENTEAKDFEHIKKQLSDNSESFAELVKAFSRGPNRDKGGIVGFIERHNLRSEFAEAIPQGSLKENSIFGPIKTAEGSYFLKITAIQAGKKAEFASHREAIRNKLLTAAREKSAEALKKRLRSQAIIRYYFKHSSLKSTVTEIDATEKSNKPEKTPAKQSIKKMEKKNMVTLKTNFGDIKLELFADAAPKTVANFLEYVNSGFYNGTLFHRVIDGFMIQGGGFDQKFKQKETRAPIENEADNRLSNEIGTIAMARTMDPHSATAQFFINVNNNDFLDYRSPSPQFYGYCVFGKVVEGMDVVNKIKGVKTGGRAGHQDVPKEDVVILEAVAE